MKKAKLITFFLLLLFLFGLIFHKEIGRIIFPFPYREIIEDISNDKPQIDSRLVAALIYVESGYNHLAVSKKGACGLMQLMPDTGSWIAEQKGISFERNDLFKPRKNLEIGIWYLRYLIKIFDRDILLTLAAYNAGGARVKEWISEKIWEGNLKELHCIPYPETRKYVARILRVYQIYSYLY